ncbi:MAG: M1 family metallopeptidase [Phototrophicaceae bacterium]
MRHLRWLWIVCFLMACSATSAHQSLPSPTPNRALALTSFPTVIRPIANIITATPVVTPTPPMASPLAPTESPCGVTAAPRAEHQVSAVVNYAVRTVDVQQVLHYPNLSGAPLTELVMNVEPNRWPSAFTLQQLTLGDANITPAFTLTGRRLDIPLPAPLLPNCALELRLAFRLVVPEVIGGFEAFRGYFGQTPRQMNLGHWLPTVVPWVNGEWLYHDTVLIGEQIVLEPADWDVTFTLTDSPAGLQIAAPGTVEQPSADVWHFTHRNGRDFAASFSNVFRVSQAQTADGVTVEAYTMPDALLPDSNGGWIDTGAYAAQIGADSLALYAEYFGEYPHPRMVIVQGDFPDGMEFSGFTFVSTDWFVTYDQTPANYLTLITVHEVAHQWWYDRVGNDQALAPWLDEALSTYSELLYLERFHPDLVAWWWWFRVNRHAPQGWVDTTVYELDQIRPYINAVYLRGVLMLQQSRQVMGDAAFFSWLARYADENTGRLATGDVFWAAVPPDYQDAVAAIRATYLRGVR